MMKILIASVFCIALGVCHGAELDRFFKISKSVIRDPTDSMRIRRIEDVEPEDCAKLCWAEVTCKTVEYKEEHRKCDLSTADYQNPEHTIITSPYGWETYALLPDERALAQLEAEVAGKSEGKSGIAAEHQKAQNFSSELQTLLSEATSELTSMQEELAAMGETKAEYEEQKKALDAAVSQYTKMLEEAEAAHGTAQSNLQGKEKSIADAQELIESLKESIQEKEALIQQATGEKSQLDASLKTARSAHHEKNQLIQKLNSQIQNLRSEIAAADEPEVIKARDCADLYKKYDTRQSGVYTIYPNGPTRAAVKVYCDMGNGGGWTVIQRRDTSKSCRYDFNRPWAEYKAGFGHPESDFWIGNENIYIMTSAAPSLRVEVGGKVATYSAFQIGRESEGYNLKQITYTGGNAGDQLSGLKGMKFGTTDHENNSGSCSRNSQGGFWFQSTRYCSRKVWFWCTSYSNRCTTVNLNARTANWGSQSTSTTMKIRPRNF